MGKIKEEAGMKMKTNFTKKEQIVILILMIVIVSSLGYKFVENKLIDKENQLGVLDVSTVNKDSKDKDPDQEKVETLEDLGGSIIVHISGQVKNPGIVEIEIGKRLVDAVEILGGLTPEADGDRINLAKKLQDEEKIYIPKIGEELQGDILGLVEVFNTAENPKTNNKDASDKIDLNICTKDDLERLPGIGEALSERIITYRDTNIFKTIEDIKNVSGIGEKKYEGLKDLIIVKWGI